MIELYPWTSYTRLSMKIRQHISSFRIIIGGFALIVFIGTLLLMLPISSANHQITPFINALFTATSAVCVTGLVVYDTAQYWSGFGQLVILLLIQIGGMGVVTIALALVAASGRKIGLAYRSTMQESINAPVVGGMVRITRFIIKGVFLLEALGAFFLSWVFIPQFGWLRGLWYAFFHSISAFCNAGFDLMGFAHPFSSLTHYADQPIVNLTIMSLIMIGGLGFMVWKDILQHHHHFHRYSLQAKVVLVTTFFLLVVPSIYFFFGEFSQYPLGKRFLASLFQSVTLRTAGFNTVDFRPISQAGLMMMSILMLIGGSPGSTAGGMKTTTFATLLANVRSVFQRDKIRLFKRTVSTDVIRSATTIAFIYVSMALIAGMLISRIENLPFVTTFFEASSAMGTVGLTLGITPSLSLVSKLVLIILMYSGRVGSLTLVFALSSRIRRLHKLPEGKISIG